MQILHILESFAAGGIETTFLHALRAFRASDPDVSHHVLSFGGGALEARYRDAAESVTIDPSPDVVELCRDRRIELVHVLFERCAYRLMPALVARSAVPVVYGKGYDMGGMYRLNEGLDWQADASLLAAADGVTFTTADLESGYGLPAGRATVLGKAADVARFAQLPVPDATTPMRIVCVANLHPRKRLGDLIEALAVVRAEVPSATLRFVGGGNDAERARLTRLAEFRGLASAVSFAGPVEDVAAELAAARVAALPSSCEGVPTALIEAMAAARPVVATRVGHVRSIIADGVEGWLVAPGDVPALASRLAHVLADQDASREMGLAGRRRAAAHDVVRVARAQLAALRAARQRSLLQVH